MTRTPRTVTMAFSASDRGAKQYGGRRREVVLLDMLKFLFFTVWSQFSQLPRVGRVFEVFVSFVSNTTWDGKFQDMCVQVRLSH